MAGHGTPAGKRWGAILLLALSLVHGWQEVARAGISSDGAADPPAVLPRSSDLGPHAGSSVILAPFYVFREEGARAWLERIQVTVKGVGPLNTPGTVDTAEVRQAIQEALHGAGEEAAIAERLQRTLGPLLKMGREPQVHLSRCFLLLP